jgi:CO dehydrogenase nickel-insertion accessory protein CooC1
MLTAMTPGTTRAAGLLAILSRGTGRHVDTLLVTLEPHYKALETFRRCAELS